MIAGPHEVMPVDPPAPEALGSRLSPMRRSISDIGTRRASAAIWVSAVHAPVPMSEASMLTTYGLPGTASIRAAEGRRRVG